MPRPRTTTQRGYGRRHQLERERWRITVETGRATCCRCGQPIDARSPWDLDHSDDRSTYNGPAHRTCNRRAGAIKGNASRQRSDQPQRTSARW